MKEQPTGQPVEESSEILKKESKWYDKKAVFAVTHGVGPRIVVEATGNIDGLETATESLEFLATKRPVTAINRGMIASAGVWYTSAAHKVIASNKAAMIGSIGVLINSLLDLQSIVIQRLMANILQIKKHLINTINLHMG